MFREIAEILEGIDRGEMDNEGWWEASSGRGQNFRSGADFGKKKLDNIRKLILGI